MTKYVFVGDIHGKVECVERALSMDGTKIFVGDLMDSFDRTPEEHATCLRLVLDAVGRKEARVTYGNHELSYMRDEHKCSGWSMRHFGIMVANADEIKEKFEPYILLAPDFLVTHAGLTKQLWDGQHLSLDTLAHSLDEWWPDRWSPMHFISRMRGGYDGYGGTFWCDYRYEFRHVPGLNQVFGHTTLDKMSQMSHGEGTSYCIDFFGHNGEGKDLPLLELEI